MWQRWNFRREENGQIISWRILGPETFFSKWRKNVTSQLVRLGVSLSSFPSSSDRRPYVLFGDKRSRVPKFMSVSVSDPSFVTREYLSYLGPLVGVPTSSLPSVVTTRFISVWFKSLTSCLQVDKVSLNDVETFCAWLLVPTHTVPGVREFLSLPSRLTRRRNRRIRNLGRLLRHIERDSPGSLQPNKGPLWMTTWSSFSVDVTGFRGRGHREFLGTRWSRGESFDGVRLIKKEGDSLRIMGTTTTTTTTPTGSKQINKLKPPI